MSRIGNKLISIPNGVKASLNDRKIQVEGPKGKLDLEIDETISCELKDSEITFTRSSDERTIKAKHGLYRSLVSNMIEGVSNGFKKELVIEGVGYRVQAKGQDIALDLGFSHQVNFKSPEGIKITVSSPTSLSVEGIDKQKVGQAAADIRALKKPEPYKGKGIRYADEVVRRKQGKKVG